MVVLKNSAEGMAKGNTNTFSLFMELGFITGVLPLFIFNKDAFVLAEKQEAIIFVTF